MKIRHTTTSTDDGVQLQMTPMIDIVFQLLVFFIMSFKIVAQEGDFNIKMPLAAAGGAPQESQALPLKLYLTADSRGELQLPIVLNEMQFDDFPALTAYVAGYISTDGGPGSGQNASEVEVELHFDANLRYEFVVHAIDAVSGQVDPRTGRVTELIQKIKFAPQTQGP